MTVSTSSDARQFLTLEELRQIFGIGASAAYELARKNQLPVPVFRVGRQFRASRAAVEALLTAQHLNRTNSDTAA